MFTGYFLFFWIIRCKPEQWLWGEILIDQQFVRYLDFSTNNYATFKVT